MAEHLEYLRKRTYLGATEDEHQYEENRVRRIREVSPIFSSL